MDPRLFLTLAETLVHHPEAGPAECRTAISRAYYAAYLVAVAFLAQMKLRPKSGVHRHAAVRNALLAGQDALIIKAGTDLDTLHIARTHAEYDLNNSGPEQPKTAQALVQQATRLIAELDRCAGKPVRLAQVATAVKMWATTTPGSGLVVI